MNPEAFARARELFHGLCELPRGEQQSRLNELEEHSAVLTILERLLRHDVDDGALSSVQAGDVGRFLASGDAGVPRQCGPYRLLRKLGEGGMGVVYEARRQQTNETVALKVLHPWLRESSHARRFQREVRLLRTLDHPGIAAFFDAGETTTGDGPDHHVSYLAMEFVDGVDLLRHADQAELDTSARLELIARVCDAVHAAHRSGIVHRDLKPANVLVLPTPNDPIGQPKVLDFGIAFVEQHGESRTLTETGAVLGTVPYMSPEQISGAGSDVSVATDVYALAVLAYELLSGELPYPVRGLPIASAARMIEERYPQPIETRFGSALDRVLGKALEKDPSNRYASARALAEDFRCLRDGRPVQAHGPSWATRGIRLASRNPKLAAALLGILLALLVGVFLTTRFAVREGRLRRAADASALEVHRAAHFARLQSAVSALALHDIEQARKVLESCDIDNRSWAWRHLWSRLDDSASWTTIPDAQGVRKQLAFDSSGEEALAVLRGRGREAETHVYRWDLKTGPVEHVRAIAQVAALHLTEDGQRLVILSTTGEVRVEETESGRRLHSIRIAQAGVADSTVSVHAAGVDTSLVVVGVGDMLFGWDTRTASVEELPWPSESIADPELRFWAWNEEGAVRVADSRTGERSTLDTNGEPIAIGRGGRVAVETEAGERIELWASILSGRTVSPGPEHVFQHEQHELITRILVEGRLDRCVTFGRNGTLYVWSSRTGELIRSLHGLRMPPRRVAFNADGTQLISIDAVGQAQLWDLASQPGILLETPAATVAVHGVAETPGVLYLAQGGRWGQLSTIAGETRESSASVPRLSRVQQLAQQESGPLLAVSGWESDLASELQVVVFDRLTGTWGLLPEASPPREGNLGLAFSPNGELLVVQDEHRGLELFEVASSRSGEGSAIELRPRAFKPRDWNAVRGTVSFSPDGRFLAARSRADGAGLYDPEDLQLLRELPCSGAILTDLAFSPDGSVLAGAFRDHTIRLWNPETGEIGATSLPLAIEYAATVLSWE